jgi:hypothetical protein
LRSQALSLYNTYRSILENSGSAVWRHGLHWYRSANATAEKLAADHDVRPETAARCLAILSPNTLWTDVVQAASGVLSGDRAKAISHHGLRRNIRKALKAAAIDGPEAGRLVTGPKVSAFYKSIMLQEGAVCVDRWMYRPNRVGYRSSTPPKGFHQSATRAVRMLAGEHGTETYQTQAIIWVQLRSQS